MQPGDFVIYVADPLLYGRLWIVGTHHDGRLLCEAVRREHDGTYARELFEPMELELADRWTQAKAAA
jgi:hypothetical protein